MNSTVLLSLLSSLAFTLSAVILILRKKNVIMDTSVFVPLFLSIILYDFIVISNLLEHSSITGYFDPFEDVAEIVFTLVFLFFFNNCGKKKSFETIQRQEVWLRSALASMGDGVVTTDQDGQILLMNSAMKKLTGWTWEDTFSKNVKDVLFFVNQQNGEFPEYEPFKLVMAGGKSPSLYNRLLLVSKDGKQVPIAGNITPIRGVGDEILGFIGVFRDMTDLRQAEESLRFTQFSFDNAAIGIWYIDENARILDVNKNGAGLLGYLPEELKNMFIPDIDPSVNKETWKGIWQLLLDNGADNFETAHKHKNGKLIPVEITTNLFEYENRRFAVCFSTDITQRKQMEEVMIQSEKMLSVGGLAAGMAHEINNPLSVIVQNANVLKNRLMDKNMMPNIKAAQSLETDMETISRFMEQRSIPRMLDAINDAGLRMAAIVENMLNFARKSDASFSTHDPVVLMDKVLELASADYDLKKHYDFKSITIEKEYADNLPMVACESAKIQQVILNILNNGAHAMFESPKEIKPKFILRLSHEQLGNLLRIEIEDNGPGMDKDTSKRIFEPFFTTKPVGVGTGLGLSVSYFIITENHNGSIDLPIRSF